MPTERELSVADGSLRPVDIIDASDYDFLLPRRFRKLAAFAFVMGVAFVPPVQRWYLSQIEHHAEHVTEEFIASITPSGGDAGLTE